MNAMATVAAADERRQFTPGLVSVVICAYNNWPDLEMTIESALGQSHLPLEVIVVDNSSTDATPLEVPRRYSGKVHYIRQPNRGDGGAYNTGFEQASGEFIQFVDGDDVLAPNKIQKQVDVFLSDPTLDIVYGDIRIFQGLDGAANWKDVTTRPPEDDMVNAFLIPKDGWSGINVLGTLFHRKTLVNVGRWDEELYISDLDYFLRAASAGCRFKRSESLMGFSRRRPGQMSADRSAMARGLEALWDKTLSYAACESHRNWISAELARKRFDIAVSRDRMSKREALSMLARARRTNSDAVPLLKCVAGVAAIALPGGMVRAVSRGLRPIRRLLER